MAVRTEPLCKWIEEAIKWCLEAELFKSQDILRDFRLMLAVLDDIFWLFGVQLIRSDFVSFNMDQIQTCGSSRRSSCRTYLFTRSVDANPPLGRQLDFCLREAKAKVVETLTRGNEQIMAYHRNNDYRNSPTYIFSEYVVTIQHE